AEIGAGRASDLLFVTFVESRTHGVGDARAGARRGAPGPPSGRGRGGGGHAAARHGTRGRRGPASRAAASRNSRTRKPCSLRVLQSHRLRAGGASRGLGRVHVRGQGLLRDLDERGERRRVVHGQLGQDLAVDLDVRGLQTLDEAVVRDAVGAGSGVDALDPQLAEVTLALLAVVVVVDQRVGDLLLGLAVEARTLTAVAGSLLEDRPARLVGVDCPLDACHLLTPCSGAAVVLTRPGNRLGPGLTYGARSGRRASLAEKLLDLRGVARGHLGVAGEATRHTGRLVLEQVRSEEHTSELQ